MTEDEVHSLDELYRKKSKDSVLVACEESQAVTIAFRQLGVEAWSCDLSPCSGGHPEWHLQQDVIPLLSEQWSMIIAFPPCTHLCSSGARWFKEKQKSKQQQAGIEFFMRFTKTKCKKVAIENPVGIMSGVFRNPDQIIQPWQFGHGEVKSTCLWLIGLPRLKPTNIVKGREEVVHQMPPSKDRSVLRSKTYLGIAEAMAAQWSKEIGRQPRGLIF